MKKILLIDYNAELRLINPKSFDSDCNLRRRRDGIIKIDVQKIEHLKFRSSLKEEIKKVREAGKILLDNFVLEALLFKELIPNDWKESSCCTYFPGTIYYTGSSHYTCYKCVMCLVWSNELSCWCWVEHIFENVFDGFMAVCSKSAIKVIS
ncbi:MAG: hypothetical protein AAB696_00575 [Patescibacteria group bacterium]